MIGKRGYRLTIQARELEYCASRPPVDQYPKLEIGDLSDTLPLLERFPLGFVCEPIGTEFNPFLKEIGDMPYKLTVNGQPKTVDAPPDMPLLWALRDVLNMKGTKFGCGIGQCGACTVQIGGQARRACQTQISAVNAPIITIEGLSGDGSHPLQKAWLELDVPQCGYCQAGQLMSAAALLARTPKPTDADIDQAMTGNVCRCGTYLRIREAIHLAANGGRKA